MDNVNKGIFHPKIPVHSILLFVSTFIDGISQSVVLDTTQGDSHLIIDIPDMFQTLAMAIISLL